MSKSNIVPRNAKCIYDTFTLSSVVPSQHTCYDWLKVASITVAKHVQQNQAISLKFLTINLSRMVSG